VRRRTNFFTGTTGAVDCSGTAGVSTVSRRIVAGGKAGNTRGTRALTESAEAKTDGSLTAGLGLKSASAA